MPIDPSSFTPLDFQIQKFLGDILGAPTNNSSLSFNATTGEFFWKESTSGGPLLIKKLVDQVTVEGETVQDPVLKFAVTTGKTYLVYLNILATDLGLASPKIKFGFDVPAGTTISGNWITGGHENYIVPGDGNLLAGQELWGSAYGDPTCNWLTFVAGANGFCTLQYADSAVGGVQPTILAGSFLRVEELG